MLIADGKKEPPDFLQYFGLASRMGYLYWLRALQLPSSHRSRHPNRRRRGRPNAPLPMRTTSQERRECPLCSRHLPRNCSTGSRFDADPISQGVSDRFDRALCDSGGAIYCEVSMLGRRWGIT